MTDKQPDALRLADLLQDECGVDGYVLDESATELRRLHLFAEGMIAHNTMTHTTRSRLLAENETLKVDRDELLNTLKVATWMLEREYIDDLKTQVIEMCYATVRKVEGDKSG